MGNLSTDGKGNLIEKITFSNGVEDYKYASDMHKLVNICNWYGLDINNHSDFIKAESILKEQS